MDQGEWPLSRVEETVNSLTKYGKPIYITEISVLSGEHGRSLSTVNRAEMQEMSGQFDSMSDKAKGTLSADATTKLAADAKSLLDPNRTDEAVSILKRLEKTAAQLQDSGLKDAALSEIKKSETWASTPEGEKRQADYTENLYKLLHNNPHVHCITWWDMSDKDSWKMAPRGWFRADGSPKPVVDRMKRLFDEWKQGAAER